MAETRPSKETFAEWHTTKGISHMSVKQYVQYCKCAFTFRVGDEFLVHHGDASRPYSATIVGSFRGYVSDGLFMFGVREPRGMFYHPGQIDHLSFTEIVPNWTEFRYVWNIYRYRPTNNLHLVKRINKATPI